MRVATSGMANSGRSEGAERVKNAILIAGPTASGKSALALDLAMSKGGVIVNADSMQVYTVLDVLTARPGTEDQARAPHHLYGHVSPATAYSTGAWLRDVTQLVADGALEGRAPIFVGGTGLYFRALVEGISQMPDIPATIRDHWRNRLIEEGAEPLHRVLSERDPEMAQRLKPGDGQRIVRALEVLEASGRSILAWQGDSGTSLIDLESASFFVLEPERPILVRRIEQRFDRMLEAGALEEVRAIAAMRLDPALPAMKAIGVRELQAADAGAMEFSEAISRAKIATRQYAKRQTTWFRNQFGPEWKRLNNPQSSV